MILLLLRRFRRKGLPFPASHQGHPSSLADQHTPGSEKVTCFPYFESFMQSPIRERNRRAPAETQGNDHLVLLYCRTGSMSTYNPGTPELTQSGYAVAVVREVPGNVAWATSSSLNPCFCPPELHRAPQIPPTILTMDGSICGGRRTCQG